MTGTLHRPVVDDPARDTTWHNHARCRTHDNPDLWFPISYERDRKQVRKAKAECRKRPVTRECLAWALAVGQPDGIWGGKTPSQRRPRSFKEDVA